LSSFICTKTDSRMSCSSLSSVAGTKFISNQTSSSYVIR
jgi:hypothetical protein